VKVVSVRLLPLFFINVNQPRGVSGSTYKNLVFYPSINRSVLIIRLFVGYGNCIVLGVGGRFFSLQVVQKVRNYNQWTNSSHIT